jgi:hypothetical protein
MNTERKINKKDIIVSILCLVFVLMIVGSVGEGGRRSAKEKLCMANLSQWGKIFTAFSNDNNGYLFQGWFGDPPPATSNGEKKLWMCVTWNYYQDPNLMFCPDAIMPADLGNSTAGKSNRAWGGITGLTWCSMPLPGVKDRNGQMARWNPKGSYGENSWVANKTGSNFTNDPGYWRTMHIQNGNTVPMLGDAAWLDGWVGQNDGPPPVKDSSNVVNNPSGYMARFCIDRHTGKTNWVFMDTSVRPVLLKELFTLNWYRGYEAKKNLYTWAYYNGNGNPIALWPEWMKDFAEYTGN